MGTSAVKHASKPASKASAQNPSQGAGAKKAAPAKEDDVVVSLPSDEGSAPGAGGDEEFTINPQFEEFIPRSTKDQLRRLEEQILRDAAGACREPLLVWTEKATLLDGYKRVRLSRACRAAKEVLR